MAEGVDVVVVGGGHNGLAAALHVASRGRSVVVLEQADEVGGAVKTAEVTLPGFRHDLYAMNLSLFAGSPFARAHGERLARHGLAYTGATHCFATAFPDGRHLGVTTDAEANAAAVAAFDPADGEAWRAMTARFPAVAPHYFALLGAEMSMPSLFGVARRALGAEGRGFALEASRLLLSSPRQFLDDTFRSPEVKALLAPWAMHLDFPPDAAGGALFPYLEAMADQSFGMALGKGGADVVPRALAGALAEAGGTIRTGAEVRRIEVAGGRAVAVHVAGGERIAAREAVMASVTPRALLRLLGGSTGSPAIDRRLAAFRHGPGTMMIHVAASDLPPWAASEDLRRYAYVHLAPSLRTLSAAYADAMEGLIPAEPAIVVGQPTAIDPSRAPEGRHVLWIQVRVVPSVVAGDARGEIAPGAWDTVKESVADRVMAIVERYAPGTGATVLARTVLSPDDLERANPNLIGGDSLGGSHQLTQNFLFRPAPGMARHRTPVAGLFMLGASTWPGAGLGAGSGYLAARAVAGA